MAINSLSGSQASNSELKKATQTQSINPSNLNRQPQIRKETSNLQKIQEEINQSLQMKQPMVNSFSEDSTPQRLEENKGITSRDAMANAMAVENNKEIQTGKIQFIEKKQDVEEKSSTVEKVEQAVASVNDYIQNLRNRILEFTVDGGSGRMVVRVIDMDTRKTIRQIPPEEMLRIAENLGKDKGWLLEQKV